jgi:hypothetical protein
MSTKIMALVWPLQMPLLAKSVYISLADNANDHGTCWPSISTICERVCASERAVQNAVLWLEKNGALTREMSTGRSTKYLLTPAEYAPPQEMHPRTKCTTPPQEMHPTPAEYAPHPRTTCTLTVIEPSKNRKGTVNITPDNLLAGVSEKIAHDFIALRKAKKAPVTETALSGIKREAEKAGYSLERALQTCCERGWVGFKAEWVVDKNVPMVDKNDAKTRNLEAKRMLGFLDEVIDV